MARRPDDLALALAARLTRALELHRIELGFGTAIKVGSSQAATLRVEVCFDAEHLGELAKLVTILEIAHLGLNEAVDAMNEAAKERG